MVDVALVVVVVMVAVAVVLADELIVAAVVAIPRSHWYFSAGTHRNSSVAKIELPGQIECGLGYLPAFVQTNGVGVGMNVVLVVGATDVGGSLLVVSYSQLYVSTDTHKPAVAEKIVVGGQKNWIGVSVPMLFLTHST
uniref:Uncharacterized protein n=1 Tax=Anopheles culicifacies TaxID=139723 RepID=A0A182M5X4_9DIPT